MRLTSPIRLRSRALGAETTEVDTAAPARRIPWGFVLSQLVVLNVLFVLWRLVGHVALVGHAGADRRGLAIWRLERSLHLPSERSVQRPLLDHHDLMRLADGAYASLHVPVLAVTLIWLLLRHRDAYARWRDVLVVFTGVGLLLQLLPVAPPRLLPQLGVVDTGRLDGLSVYGAGSRGLTDQLASMPSIHVGWALLVACAVVGAARHRLRWLALLYPASITYVVVATGNHFWLDGVAAGALLAASYAAVRIARSQVFGRGRRLGGGGTSPSTSPPVVGGTVAVPVGGGPAGAAG
jgi:hypothetical protein